MKYWCISKVRERRICGSTTASIIYIELNCILFSNALCLCSTAFHILSLFYGRRVIVEHVNPKMNTSNIFGRQLASVLYQRLAQFWKLIHCVVRFYSHVYLYFDHYFLLIFHSFSRTIQLFMVWIALLSVWKFLYLYFLAF